MKLHQSEILGLEAYLRDIGDAPVLSRDEEQQLFQRLEAGDSQAFTEIFNRNTRLVLRVAKIYANHGLPYLDLVQEGNIGLMRAINKFDWHRTNKFSTCAIWWIRQAITRALIDKGTIIRNPIYVGIIQAKVRRISPLLTQKLGHEPTDDEMVKALIADGVKHLPETIKQCLQAPDEPLSLEAKIISDRLNDERRMLIDSIVDPSDDMQNVVDTLGTNAMLSSIIEKAKLTERELDIIQRRANGEKLVAIAKIHGITRERVRQIEVMAMAKCKRAAMALKLMGA